MENLNKDIIKLVQDDISVGYADFKIDFMGEHFDFENLYESIQNVREVMVVDEGNYVDSSFMDYMIEDLGEHVFYNFIGLYADHDKFARIFTNEDEFDLSEKQEWLTNEFFDNSYFFMKKYFDMFNIEENLEEVKNTVNLFLKRMGLKFGVVGEESYSYYVTVDNMNEETIQDIFFNENFYSVVWISRQNNKEIDRFSEFHVLSDTTNEDLKNAVNEFFGFDEFLLVDNVGAEHFDGIGKVREFKTVTYAYLEIKEGE